MLGLDPADCVAFEDSPRGADVGERGRLHGGRGAERRADRSRPRVAESSRSVAEIDLGYLRSLFA